MSSRLRATAPILSVLPALLVLSSLAGAQERADSANSLPRLFERVVPVTPTVSAPVFTVGADVFTIDSTSLTIAHPRTVSEMLAARVPGVSVLRPSGAPEAGAHLRLRGTTSVNGDPAPLVVIDGVPVETPEALQFEFFTGSSRLDDLSPEEIERIDVLHGPAASMLYAIESGRGVLAITTKRGRAGAARWHAWADGGSAIDRTRYPANYHMTGTDPVSGAPVTYCDIVAVGRGRCVAASLETWNPLQQASPFRSGSTASAGVSVSGGPFGIRGFASLGGLSQTGTLADERSSRLNLRLNAERALPHDLWIAGQLGYVRRAATVSSDQVILRGVTGAATDDDMHGFRPAQPQTPIDRDGARLTRSLRLAWHPVPWLEASGIVGRDEATQRDVHDYLGSPTSTGQNVTGHAWLASDIATIGATTSYRLMRSVQMQTLVSWEERHRRSVVFDSTTTGAVYSWTSKLRAQALRGVTLQQRIGFGERLFVNLGARRLERERVDGSGRWHPQFDASWLAAVSPSGSALRLRTAFADGVDVRSATGSSATAPLPIISRREPEHPREWELGTDLALGGRAAITATWFDQRTPNVLLLVPAGPMPGMYSSLTGGLENRGLELAANARLLNRARFRWDAAASFAAVRNRVTSLGSFSTMLYAQNGLAIGQPYGTPYPTDYRWVVGGNDDLTPIPDEIEVLGRVPSGTTIPIREASLRTELSLPTTGLRFGFLLDHRGGHRAENVTAALQCGAFRNCRAIQDPGSPLSEQLRAVVNAYLAGRALYVESASYTRLAEAALRWRLPRSWRALGGPTTTMSLEARNLVTWTAFDGPDPETASANEGESYGSIEALRAVPRLFSIRIEFQPR